MESAGESAGGGGAPPAPAPAPAAGPPAPPKVVKLAFPGEAGWTAYRQMDDPSPGWYFHSKVRPCGRAQGETCAAACRRVCAARRR